MSSFPSLSKALYNLIMGILWISFGLFWLVLNKKFVIFPFPELEENPMWNLFNIVVIIYGLWRVKRAYSIYKGDEF